MRLYFVRHGESEANLLGEFSNRGLKHGLTEKGRAQALALAQTLKGTGVARIYTSPLLRARETAAILADELGVPCEVADALREFDTGVLEGKSDSASWDSYWDVTNAWLTRQAWDRRIEGGESFRDIQDRFVPFVEQLLQTHASTAGDIVLVGHGGTYRCMLPLVLANVDFTFAMEHGMSNTAAVVAETQHDALICTDWCGDALTDSSHARQRTQPTAAWPH